MKPVKLWERKGVIYICAFLIPFVMMMVFWAICRIYPFGDSSILTGDMDIEFVNFYAYFVNTLKTKNDWSYMFAKTLGGDYPGLAAFILHDPLLFLLLLFPRDNIVMGIEMIFTLQVSIAGLFASVLLNNRYKTSLTSLLFSTGYAFSAFFFGYLVLTIYFGALMILPLVIYFFLKLIEEGKGFVPFVITAALFIFINYHMGFMLVIFLILLYVSEIIKDTGFLKRFSLIFISGLTVILIDGFFLIRTGLSLIGEKTTEGADYGFYRRFPLSRLFVSMFSGTSRNDLRPLIYCSVAAFFFIIIYFLSSKYGLREKLANLFLLCAVIFSMWINTFDAVWHGFNNPEEFYWRYAYYVSIITIALAYKGFISIVSGDEGEIKKTVLSDSHSVIITAGVMSLYLIGLFILKDPHVTVETLCVNVLLIFIIAGFCLMVMKDEKYLKPAFVFLLIITSAEMLYNSKTAYLSLNALGDPLPEMSEFKADYHDIDEVISFIK
nr:YfhO family protein [Lachnospiraceae bacterium]